MTSKKSQIALEYMLITGLLLIGVLFIFYYTSGETLIRTRIDAANDAVHAIATTANFVGVMESGSQTQIYVKIPRGVVSTNLTNNETMIKMSSYGGKITDIFAKTEVNLTGRIPDGVGVYRLNIQKVGDNVNISIA